MLVSFEDTTKYFLIDVLVFNDVKIKVRIYRQEFLYSIVGNCSYCLVKILVSY